MGNFEYMTPATTRTYYTVESYGWHEPGQSQDGYWRGGGGGGMYVTIPAAYERVKADLKRAIENKCDLSKVKLTIKKIVTTESVEEELTGPDFTVFMLKTARHCTQSIL